MEFNPSMTSLATPWGPSTAFVMRPISALGSPPRGGFQTPSSVHDSLAAIVSSSDIMAAPVAELSELGSPGCVSLEGGSIVLIAKMWNPPEPVGTPIDSARTDSATANSSLLGSNIMFAPTDITSRVTGGRYCRVPDVVTGYKYRDASQSSSNRGSSSPSDTSFGNLADRRARCVVMESNGRG
jgi:hypothetical protein